MSSYHHLIVEQVDRDRNRLVGPTVPDGASHELSKQTIASELRERRAQERDALLRAGLQRLERFERIGREAMRLLAALRPGSTRRAVG